MRFLFLVLAIASLATAAIAACGGDDSASNLSADSGSDVLTAPDSATSDATGSSDAGAVDAAMPRHVKLASGGEQLLVSGADLGLQITPANLATDPDVIEIHHEVYGVPWGAFEDGGAPPTAWTNKMTAVAQSAKATGKPIFLSITPFDGSRSRLSPATTDDPTKTTPFGADCYDFASAADAAQVKAAYLAYLTYMVKLYEPAYLNYAIEVNLFFESCPAATAGAISLANAAYDAAKALDPAIVAFPSIQIDHLYGYNASSCPDAGAQGCFDSAFAQIDPLKRDRFAMSSYPQLSVVTKPADLPADWLTRGAKKKNERPLVAETGWSSDPLVGELKNGTCYEVYDSTSADTAAYLQTLLAQAEFGNVDLFNWWSDRDLVVEKLMTDCPCTFDATWCAVLDAFRGPPPPDGGTGDPQFFGELTLKAFGTMGLRLYDGTPKADVMQRWSAYASRPLAP